MKHVERMRRFKRHSSADSEEAVVDYRDGDEDSTPEPELPNLIRCDTADSEDGIIVDLRAISGTAQANVLRDWLRAAQPEVSERKLQHVLQVCDEHYVEDIQDLRNHFNAGTLQSLGLVKTVQNSIELALAEEARTHATAGTLDVLGFAPAVQRSIQAALEKEARAQAKKVGRVFAFQDKAPSWANDSADLKHDEAAQKVIAEVTALMEKVGEVKVKKNNQIAGTALGFIPAGNFIRIKLHGLINSNLVENFLLCLIMMNLFALTLQSPGSGLEELQHTFEALINETASLAGSLNGTAVLGSSDAAQQADPGMSFNDFLARFNWFCVLVFTAEAGIRIVTLGFVVGESTYLRDAWNCAFLLRAPSVVARMREWSASGIPVVHQRMVHASIA